MAFCSRCGVSIEGRFCQACGYDNQQQEGTQNLAGSIDQLYSLRAGLSLVSSQLEKIEKNETENRAEIEKRKAHINSIEDSVLNDENEVESVKSKINDCQDIIATNEANLKENVLSNTKSQREQTVKKDKILTAFSLPFWLFTVITGVPGVLAVVVGFLSEAFLIFFGPSEPSMIKWLNSVLPFNCFLFFLAILGGGIIFSVIALILLGISLSLSENRASDLDKKIVELESISQKSAEYKCTIIPDLKRMQKELEGSIASNRQKIKEENEKLSSRSNEMRTQIAYYRECNNEVYNALVKEYSPLIDVRDWENLDLVIYYLETRRAISVREALQLADRQHQTEAIIQTFKVATEQIKETITLNSQRLENTVLGCTRVISSGLDNISGRLNAIEVNQEIAASHLRNLSSQISVNNALQAKANTSSEQMMRDIRQMRVYADNSAIKARNS